MSAYEKKPRFQKTVMPALLCFSAFAAATSGIARADTAPADNAAQLQEVIVTAERKPEFKRDVPIAVSSLSAATVDALTSSGEDIRALSAQVPSLLIESSFGRTFPRFYIRGLGNSDYTYNAQQPVGVVVDDVVIENPILKAFPAFDIQDIEVLRGPQGTLFGRNTPAGVVKIDTVKPSDEFGGYADLSYGTFNTVNVTGVVGGAVLPGVLDFRVSVLEERRDDWVTNTNALTMYHHKLEGYTDTAGRFQMLYKPTDDFSALWETDGRTLDGTARLFRANIIEKGTNHLIPGFDPSKIDTNGDNYQNLGTFGTHLTLTDDLGPVTLTSISAYEHGSTRSRGDIDGGNFTGVPPYQTTGIGFEDETSDSIPGLDQITEEIRVATNGDGPFSNQAGFFYFKEYLHIQDYDYLASGAADIISSQSQSTESYAVFDSAKYKATEDLTFGAGLRLSRDDKRYGIVCELTCVTPDPSSVSASTSHITFDVNATYVLTPDMNVYGRISSGYLAPAFDGRNVLYDAFTPDPAAAGQLSRAKTETTTSYEIGLKADLFDHKADFNLTGYTYTTDNLQLTAVGGTSNTAQLINAKKAIGEGIETEFDFKPIPALFLHSSASYNFTQIQDPNLEYAGCAPGVCTVLNQLDQKTGLYRLNHNPLPQAPRWVVDGSVKYTVPLTDGTEIYASTDWSFRSSVDYFVYRAAEFDSEPLLLGNLRIAYVDNDRGFEAAFFIHNIADEVRVTGAIDFDNTTGFVNDPRTFGGEVKYKF